MPSTAFNRRAALKTISRSLTINALCPFLLYRSLEPRFPAGSVLPLLYATAVPVLGLLVGLARKRSVDVIAAIAMVGLTLHILVTLVAR